MLLICLDGPNGVGKSSVRRKLELLLKQQGVQVAAVSDSEAISLWRRSSYSFVECRKKLQDNAARRGAVVIQERGLLSHWVFDHGHRCRPIRGIVCRQCEIEAARPNRLDFALTAPLSALRRRHLLRGAFKLHQDIESQHRNFSKVAQKLRWCVLKSALRSSSRVNASRIAAAAKRFLDDEVCSIQVPSCRVLTEMELNDLRSLFPGSTLSQSVDQWPVRLILRIGSQVGGSVKEAKRSLSMAVGKITQPSLFGNIHSESKASVNLATYTPYGVTRISDGVYVIGPPMSDVMDRLDELIAAEFEAVGAVRCGLPSLLPNWVMAQYGKEFLGAIAHRIAEHEGSVDAPSYLSHAACLPVYPTLRGQRLSSCHLVTGQATCFRNEMEYAWPRLREYHVREFVAVGSEPDVEQAIIGALKRLLGLLDAIGVCVDLIPATDVFIEDIGIRAFQRISGAKTELVFRNASPFAIGSVNRHRSHFSRHWSIEVHGQLAVSACIGIGLERIASAFLSVNGMDPSTWKSVLSAPHYQAS